MTQKVILTGPESTGKTTLARALAEYFDTEFVPEYARSYLEQTEGTYSEQDLIRIAKEQHKLEKKISGQGEFPVICDTSMLVLKIWSQVKYGRVHPWIESALADRSDALFILCAPDFTWISDPLREHPEGRNELFELYRKELEELQLDFRVARGTREERLQKAVYWIEDYHAND